MTNEPLKRLASQIDDVMHQAEFLANWAVDNRLNRYQLEQEINILIAEIWECQIQVKAMLGQQAIGKGEP